MKNICGCKIYAKICGKQNVNCYKKLILLLVVMLFGKSRVDLAKQNTRNLDKKHSSYCFYLEKVWGPWFPTSSLTPHPWELNVRINLTCPVRKKKNFSEAALFHQKNKTGHRGSALFSLFSGQQSPYMHPSAELYIPVSDVHPSLAMQITWFSLLRGIKNLEKPKKNKMTEPMSQYPKPRKTKKQKQKGRTYVPVSGMGSILLFFLFFWFLEVKPKKTTKKKRQNLCPSIWHGVSTFGFLFFWLLEVKPKKQKKKAEPMSQYLAWGHYFCFFGFLVFRGKTKKKAEPMSQYLAWGQYFCFFLVSRGKTKKTKKKGRTYVPVSGMGSVLLFFCFFGFPR